MVKLGKILIPVVAAASIFTGCSAPAATNSSTQSVNTPTLREVVGEAATKPPIVIPQTQPAPIVDDDDVDRMLELLTSSFVSSGTTVRADRENKIFVLTLHEDLTALFILALDGDRDAIKLVEEIFEAMRRLSSTVYEGCEFSVAIANPLVPDKLIYVAFDGIEVFNYLD